MLTMLLNSIYVPPAGQEKWQAGSFFFSSVGISQARVLTNPITAIQQRKNCRLGPFADCSILLASYSVGDIDSAQQRTSTLLHLELGGKTLARSAGR